VKYLKHWKLIVKKSRRVRKEVADVYIKFLDLCGSRNIDLEVAIIFKMELNKARSYNHGNKE
jgi:NTP pyrophosphatase (non-canonical NTP hydrolase)